MDRFEALVKDGFEKVEGSLTAIDQRLAAMEAKEVERKGAWKMGAAIAAFVSAFVGYAISWIK